MSRRRRVTASNGIRHEHGDVSIEGVRHVASRARWHFAFGHRDGKAARRDAAAARLLAYGILCGENSGISAHLALAPPAKSCRRRRVAARARASSENRVISSSK